jgi:hypothetical protein
MTDAKEYEGEEIELKDLKDNKYIKAVWTMLTDKRYGRYWWTMTAILIAFIIIIKTMDAVYPPSVCFCDCDFSNGFNICMIDGQKAFIKRWGALENCSAVCDAEGLTLIEEVNYTVYADRVKGCNNQIRAYCNSSLINDVFCV